MTLRERLAELEHFQWSVWMIHYLARVEPHSLEDARRWLRQANIPYTELSEAEKESDREWADKVLCLLKEFDMKLP